MASGYTARRWEKIRELLYITRVFFLLLAHEILCALNEESTPVPSYLPCDADVQAHSGRYCLKSGIAPAVSSCLIPHRLLPRRSPGRRGGLTAPPRPIPVHRLPLADSLARCLLSLPELGRYVRSSTTVARCCSRPIRSSPCGSPPPSMSILLPYFFICCCWLLFLSVYLIWRLLVCFTSSLHSVYLIFFCQSKFKKLGDVSGQSLSNCCILYVSFCSKLFIDGCSVLYNELVTSNYM